MATNLSLSENEPSKLPRAIAKEKDGLVMYWVDELDEGGLHLKALARLLDYDHGSLGKAIKAVEGLELLRAEILTEGGVKMVELLTGKSVAKILRFLTKPGSKVALPVQERANDLRDQLAEAGFKLAVMLELAPERLAAQAMANLDEKEMLKLRREVLRLEDKTLSLRHYVATALPKAVGDRILGVTEIETVKVKEVVVNEKGQILGHAPGESLNKKELCERYGLLTKAGKPDYKQINAYLEGLALPNDAWEDRQIVSHNPQLKVEYLERLDKLLGKVDRQQWLGER